MSDSVRPHGYSYNRVQIRAAALQRGRALYNRAIVVALGAMLEKGASSERYDGTGRWLDVAGQYISKRVVEQIIDQIESGELTTIGEVDNAFRIFAVHYDDYAHSWAEEVYASLLGHTPTAEEIQEAIEAGRNAAETMRRTTDADRDRDYAPDMAVSYGLDCDTIEERMADFRAVHNR